MTSSAFHRTIVLPASVCQQAAHHLEQAVHKAIDGAATPWRAFRGADGDDFAFSVPVVEQAAGRPPCWPPRAPRACGPRHCDH
ncbi:hypothetical protein SVIOM342S_03483 [Streptomyces violaceorubidus]